MKLQGACIAADGAHGIWIGRNDGTIGRYNFTTQSIRNTRIIGHDVPSHLRSISKIYPISDSELLIGCFTRGLKIYNHKTGALTSLPLTTSRDASVYVRDIVEGESGQYWIATESGIYIYDLRTRTVQHLQKK
ncbi:hypothetical protein LWM68_27405 [Niabella sp. W65]|nr:hypothetical protein [Niabella sp. W65]MCH7366170.1 hypothetical protein [Niabella sp. W65]